MAGNVEIDQAYAVMGESGASDLIFTVGERFNYARPVVNFIFMIRAIRFPVSPETMNTLDLLFERIFFDPLLATIDREKMYLVFYQNILRLARLV